MIPLLSSEQIKIVKNQSFVRADRIKELLESVQNTLIQNIPDLKDIMKLYIENSTARTILLKPVLHEFDQTRRKLEIVMMSCIDPGQVRRHLESLLRTVTMIVATDLNM